MTVTVDNPMHTGDGFRDELTMASEIVFLCDECGDPIEEGDSFLPACGLHICENCADHRQVAVSEEECMDFHEEDDLL